MVFKTPRLVLRPWRPEEAPARYWGQGLIPEAVGELLRYGFEELGLERVWCGSFEGNDKSRRVQEECGFRHCRTERDLPWPLMGDTRTEHISCLDRARRQAGCADKNGQNFEKGCHNRRRGPSNCI